MASRFGSLASLAARAKDSLRSLQASAQGKVQVGSDSAGNRYFIAKEHRSGANKKRWVEYPRGMSYAEDSKTVPMVWYAWLHHSRDAPPSESEVAAELAAQTALRARVAKLEQADAKLRMQEIAERQLANGGQSAMHRKE
jgi:NADH:ubiquinone oxidoreductase subunit